MKAMPEKQPPHVTSQTLDGVLVIRINERQFHGDSLADAIRQEMLALIAAAGSQKIVIDLQPVDYLSSAAFRPLLSLRRKLQETGGRMVLCNLSPLVAEVFQLLRLISTSRSYPATFEVQPDVAAAVAFLNKPAGSPIV
jgi:anti-sigma B factor antagonist